MKRAQLADEVEESAYFAPKSKVAFFSSGCCLLDCALGGGWALGRISNLVGDKSTGKTLLAIEACANFHRKHPAAAIYYIETEAAFDESYAAQLGLPVDSITFPESITVVEEAFNYLEQVVAREGDEPALVILDSLDALSDKAEVERAIGEGTYGAAKAKLLSQLFRRLVRKLSHSNTTVLIVSQVRDNIGAMFGDKHTRSGGRALDFYSSQILWLSQIKKLTLTKKKIERIVGVQVKALCKKNKVGPSFREVEFPIHFGFGVEDVVAGVEWLDKAGHEMFGGKEGTARFKKSLDRMDASEYRKHRKQVRAAVKEAWADIEEQFAPTRRKY